MNAVAPTVQLSTISAPAAPAPEAATDTPNGAAPPAPKESGAASGVVEKKPETDPNLEISRRLGEVSKKEAKARRAEQEHQERMASLSQKEKDIEAKLAELDGALSDPVKYMLDKGKDPVEVARRFSKPESEEEKRIRKLEERDAANTKAQEEAKEAAERARVDRERHEITRSFVSEINEENSPHLVALYAAGEVPGLVRELLNRPYIDEQGRKTGESTLQAFQAEHGRDPTNAEIRESLEAEAQSRATKIIESHQRRNGGGAPSQASETGQTQAPVKKTASGPSGISNTHASVTTSGKPKKLSLEEKRKAARKELTEALEAEATERS